MHDLVKLAKKAVERYTQSREIIAAPAHAGLEMRERAGVFVSLKIKGELRGCIGTFEPSSEDIAHEIIQNAVSAASRDPRFSPVSVEELDDVTYSVDVLTAPEKISGTTELDPKKYGVIVKSGRRRGLLLPDLEGVDSVEDQVQIAATKAGITMDDKIELYRFEVKRYR